MRCKRLQPLPSSAHSPSRRPSSHQPGRVFERQWGSKKYGAYALAVTGLSYALQLSLGRLAALSSGTAGGAASSGAMPSGPMPIIFASFVPFLLSVPPTSSFSLLGLSMTDKAFVYMAGAQLLFTSGRRSLLLGGCALLAGLAWHTNLLGCKQFRVRHRAMRVRCVRWEGGCLGGGRCPGIVARGVQRLHTATGAGSPPQKQPPTPLSDLPCSCPRRWRASSAQSSGRCWRMGDPAPRSSWRATAQPWPQQARSTAVQAGRGRSSQLQARVLVLGCPSGPTLRRLSRWWRWALTARVPRQRCGSRTTTCRPPSACFCSCLLRGRIGLCNLSWNTSEQAAVGGHGRACLAAMHLDATNGCQ